MIEQNMGKRAEGEEKATAGIHMYGDVLEAIISQVPLIDLLPAYDVSKDWRCTVRRSLSIPSRAKPWLIVHIQSSRNPSSVVTRAYDPESQMWVEIPRTKIPETCLPIRSSQSNLVYTLTSSKLSFSVDPLNAKWHDVDGLKVCRLDPIVAVIGSHIVIAGGTYDFEEDSLAVEIYCCKSRRWEVCQSMPDILKGYASATWLSVAVSDQKLFVLEKRSGTFCTFDPITKTWGGMFDIRPIGSLFLCLIGFSNDRLVLIGLTGDTENVESLRIWEVNSETFYSNEVGKMPPKMLQEVIDSCSSPSSINISMASDTVYIYNSEDPKKIIFCDLSNGSCNWGSVQNPIVDYQNIIHRFVFTCSKVGFNDLQKAFGMGNRR